VPANNGVGEIEREAALAACRTLIGWKERWTEIGLWIGQISKKRYD
jgi:hypothetical protein